MITARARSSASAHLLSGAVRGRAAAFDEPGHCKTRHTFDLSTAQHKLYPGRARRDGAKPLRHRADPSLLAFEARQERDIARQQVNVRAGAKGCVAGLGVHFVSIEGLSTLIPRCWSRHRTLLSRAATRAVQQQQRGSQRRPRPRFFNFVDQVPTQAQIDESALAESSPTRPREQ